MSKRFGIVVVGASAGGIPVLRNLVASLPTDLAAAVFVVLHLGEVAPSLLPNILGRAGTIKVEAAVDGAEIRPGCVYVAVPGHHLLVEEGRVGVKRGPKENRFRPSIDALFRSAAYSYRDRVVGVVLSGMLSDGVSGLWTIKQFGGATVVQDPSDAEFDSMPASALEEVAIDHVVRGEELASLIGRLSAEICDDAPAPAPELVDRVAIEVEVAASKDAFERGLFGLGPVTPFTCPECHGALIRIEEGRSVRYRCHTGHGFSSEALLSGITDSVEASLWNALRAMEEGVMLLETMARHLEGLDRPEQAAGLRRRADAVRDNARLLQSQVTSPDGRFTADHGS